MQEIIHADERPGEAALAAIDEKKAAGPPKATLKRRAQSYTDFHYAVNAVLKEGRALERSHTPISKSTDDLETVSVLEDGLRTDLDFADLYQGLEDALLDSSHDEYVYVSHLQSSDIDA